MATPKPVLKAMHADAQEKSAKLAVAPPQRQPITISLSERQLAVVRAIGAVLDVASPDDIPLTEAKTVEWILEEGLIACEKEELKTRSMDHSIRGDKGDDLPKTTPVMLALIAATSPKDVYLRFVEQGVE